MTDDAWRGKVDEKLVNIEKTLGNVSTKIDKILDRGAAVDKAVNGLNIQFNNCRKQHESWINSHEKKEKTKKEHSLKKLSLILGILSAAITVIGTIIMKCLGF